MFFLKSVKSLSLDCLDILASLVSPEILTVISGLTRDAKISRQSND